MLGWLDSLRISQIAEGVVDEVGPHHLINMHIIKGKQNEQIPHGLKKKSPKKISSEKKLKKYLVTDAVQGGCAYGKN